MKPQDTSELEKVQAEFIKLEQVARELKVWGGFHISNLAFDVYMFDHRKGEKLITSYI